VTTESLSCVKILAKKCIYTINHLSYLQDRVLQENMYRTSYLFKVACFVSLHCRCQGSTHVALLVKSNHIRPKPNRSVLIQGARNSHSHPRFILHPKPGSPSRMGFYVTVIRSARRFFRGISDAKKQQQQQQQQQQQHRK